MEKVKTKTSKILVVDDEPQFERLIRQRFRKSIKAGDYEFVFAQHGVEALELLQVHRDIDMVLTDINMPQMDGLTLLSRLKTEHPQLRTIVISAYGDMLNIRAAMNRGAFDFITKPIDFSDLKTTIDKTLAEALLIAQAQQVQQVESHNEHLEELHRMKSHFFTNISHELRTPLTVISGITELLTKDPKKWEADKLAMIQRNSNQLLDLVNQILDLRKLESGKMALQWIQADVIAFLKYLFEPFFFLAELQKIQLHFLPHQASLKMDYDPDKLLRVMSNLLSNAIKHTPAGGHVYLLVSQSQEQLLLKVKDTGKGIPAAQLPFIFDRYYQNQKDQENGTGIGLALTKELVKLMAGTIEVESNQEPETLGTEFRLHLPIHHNAALAPNPVQLNPSSKLTLQRISENAKAASPSRILADAEDPKARLLIVEDNADIVDFLRHCLQDDYALMVAQDGQTGIELALEKIPDIIISDVMMPRKDGFELCQTLKADERSSHIPIVLLTAKSDLDSRLEGLRQGADAYLPKPFHQEELMVVLEQLIQQRIKLRARYANLTSEVTRGLESVSSPETPSVFAMEDAFLLKAKTLVKEHLPDNTFSAKVLCKKLGMSYSVLHRKLAAVVGRSPSLFIRSIRLQQAKQLLHSTNATISEIAYDCGFNDPKFFSRVFSEEFGAAPSTLRQQYLSNK